MTTYYSTHKEQVLNTNKKWRENNKIFWDKYNKEYMKGYNQRGYVKERKNKYSKQYYKNILNDENFMIKIRLRRMFGMALNHYTKTGKIRKAKEYGIDYNAIIQHIGKKPRGDYHIDHIKPLSSFDLTDTEQIKQAFSPNNHQWLTAKENLSKHDSWNGGEGY